MAAAAPRPGFSASFPVPDHTDEHVIGAQQMLTEYMNHCAGHPRYIIRFTLPTTNSIEMYYSYLLLQRGRLSPREMNVPIKQIRITESGQNLVGPLKSRAHAPELYPAGTQYMLIHIMEPPATEATRCRLFLRSP